MSLAVGASDEDRRAEAGEAQTFLIDLFRPLIH